MLQEIYPQSSNTQGMAEDTETQERINYIYTKPRTRIHNITLEGPEDRHLRNSSCGGHVTSLTLQYLCPRPLGFDWEGLAASRGTAGGHYSSRPLI